jgi:hypothetical protein
LPHQLLLSKVLLIEQGVSSAHPKPQKREVKKSRPASSVGNRARRPTILPKKGQVEWDESEMRISLFLAVNLAFATCAALFISRAGGLQKPRRIEAQQGATKAGAPNTLSVPVLRSSSEISLAAKWVTAADNDTRS